MERFLLKEFAKTPTIQTGVYGSEIQGNAIYSEDYTEIQSGTAWEQGIGGATSNALEQPALNDDQGVYKVLCKAIKNGQVSGIPLWLNTETYYKGSICLILSNNIPYLYYSLTDNNIGNNPLNDTVNWQQFDNNKANIDLSNLSSSGQNLFNNKANIDLSNLSSSGQNLFNNKANIDLSNVPSSINFMTEVGGNYTKWRNGFTISKGSKDFGKIGSNAGINVVINLPTPMTGVYMVNVTLTFTGTYFADLGYSVVNKTTTSFTVRIFNLASGNSAAGSLNWIAVGY